MGDIRLRWGCYLIVAAAMTAAGGCKRAEEPAGASAGPVVRVALPTVRNVTDYAYFTGRTDAVESVNVQSRVTGYLNSIDFKPGTDVKAGQQLFLIDPRPYQAELDQSNGQVQLAEARLKLAKADYARALALAKTPGAISQQDVDKYAASQSEAEAALVAAKANSESARLNVEFTRVLSPVDGVVGRNLMTIGNLVKRDETLLTTVVSQDPMYAYFDIDDHTMLRHRTVGSRGQTQADRGQGLSSRSRWAFRTKATGIRTTARSTSSTIGWIRAPARFRCAACFRTRCLVRGICGLLAPGLFVRIRLPIGEPHDAMLVPRGAVGTDQGKKYLLVVNDTGHGRVPADRTGRGTARRFAGRRAGQHGANQGGPASGGRTRRRRPKQTVPSIAATDRMSGQRPAEGPTGHPRAAATGGGPRGAGGDRFAQTPSPSGRRPG